MESGKPTPSAHYRIDKDGSIHQLVTLEDINWGPIVHDEPANSEHKTK